MSAYKPSGGPLTVQQLIDLLHWAKPDDTVWIETDDENSPDEPFRCYAVSVTLELTADGDTSADPAGITNVGRKVVIR